MTDVKFYILQASSHDERRQFACRLASKMWKNGHRVYIHTENNEDAASMDELLWSFRDHSFLPHRQLLDKRSPPSPVEIGFGDDPGEHHDVMINLTSRVPSFVGRFETVQEVVVQDETLLEQFRENYRYYKSRGYPMETHKLD